MIDKIKEWWKRHNEDGIRRADEYHKMQSKEKAIELYQVQEFNNSLWFTYNDQLVCPTSFFKDGDNIVKVIKDLRLLYINEVCGCGIIENE